MHPFGITSAWPLVGVEVIRLFGSLISQKGHDVEETCLSEAITACVDTFQAVSDQVKSCCVKCRQTTQLRAPPDAEVQWLSTLLPGDLYVVEYVGEKVAHSRLALWTRGGDVWIGLAPDDDLYPESSPCPRPDSGPRGAGPPGSTRLPVNSLWGLPSR